MKNNWQEETYYLFEDTPYHLILFKDLMKKNKVKTTEQADNCKELWDRNNGVTLCRECHNWIHRNNLEQWARKIWI